MLELAEPVVDLAELTGQAVEPLLDDHQAEHEVARDGSRPRTRETRLTT